MLKRAAKIAGLVALFAFPVLLWIWKSYGFPIDIDACQHTGANHQCEYYAPEHIYLVVFGKIGEALSDFTFLAALVTALATVYIARFTLALRKSTDKLFIAGEKQRFLSEDTARRQLRAYVGVDDLKFELIGEPFVVLILKNYGTTPAHGVSTYANVIGVPNPKGSAYTKISPKYDFPDHKPEGDAVEAARVVSRFILQPQQSHPSRTPLHRPDAINAAEKGDRSHTMYIYGHVDYSDIYETRWSNVFCFMYESGRPVGQRFLPYESHNYEKKIS